MTWVRLRGGAADGRTVPVPSGVALMLVQVTMVDGLPTLGPSTARPPTMATLALLERAYGTWELYRWDDSIGPGQQRVYVCVRGRARARASP